ncbi:MAG: tetratricopeptide repeat protein [Telluria sp.]
MKKLLLCSFLAAACGFAHAGIDDADDAFRAGRFKEAYDEYVKLAEHNNARAHFMLAMMYVNGQVVSKDLDKAIEHANIAGEYGVYAGYSVIGQAYLIGQTGQRDPAKAIEWYTRAAEHKDTNAMRALSRLYIEGKLVPQDKEKGVALLERAVDFNDIEALLTLGKMYETGGLVPQDPEHALKLYERVLKRQGVAHKEVSYRIGRLYEAKQTTPGYISATEAYKDAVRGGNAEAMLALGRLAEEGKGTPADPKDALAWYRKAADAGNAPALARAGAMYERGLGVERSDAEAYGWYARAANRSVLPGLLGAARLQDAGRGTVVDHAGARRNYCDAVVRAQGQVAERLNALPETQMTPWIMWLGVAERCAARGAASERATARFRQQVGEAVGAGGVARAHALAAELKGSEDWTAVLSRVSQAAQDGGGWPIAEQSPAVPAPAQ